MADPLPSAVAYLEADQRYTRCRQGMDAALTDPCSTAAQIQLAWAYEEAAGVRFELARAAFHADVLERLRGLTHG